MSEDLNTTEESAVPEEYVEKDAHFIPPPEQIVSKTDMPSPAELARMRKHYLNRLKDENEVLMAHTMNMRLKIEEYELTKRMEKINEDILKERVKDESKVE